ncbi:MAG: hypothetical protein VX252_03870 [Myxococcota bacterium]|nr:hypothetical protein [Myxococcota bacterium]
MAEFYDKNPISEVSAGLVPGRNSALSLRPELAQDGMSWAGSTNVSAFTEPGLSRFRLWGEAIASQEEVRSSSVSASRKVLASIELQPGSNVEARSRKRQSLYMRLAASF